MSIMNATIALPSGIFQRASRSPERWERSLPRREIFRLETSGELLLSCLDGVLWLTIDGDNEDYVLQAGQAMRLSDGQQATIQALRAARFGVGRR